MKENRIIFAPEAIKQAADVIGKPSKKSTAPILEYYLLEVSGDQATLTVSDLEVTNSYQFSIENPSNCQASLAIPPEAVAWCTQVFDPVECTILLSEGRIELATPRAKQVLAIMDGLDFPSMPLDSKPVEVEIDDLIYGAIKTAKRFVAHDELRPIMNGVSLRFVDGFAYIAASDSHTLYSAKFPAPTAPNLSVIIPHNATIAPGMLLVTPKHLVCKPNSGGTFACRLIEGEYPAYQSIIPQDFTSKGDVFVPELKEALALLELSGGMTLVLESDGRKAKISNENIDFARKGEVLWEVVIPAIRLGLSPQWFKRIVDGAAKHNRLKMKFNEPNQAVLFESDDKNELFLIMPITL